MTRKHGILSFGLAAAAAQYDPRLLLALAATTPPREARGGRTR